VSYKMMKFVVGILGVITMYYMLWFVGFMRHAYLWNELKEQWHSTDDESLREEIRDREWQAIDAELDPNIVRKFRNWNPDYMKGLPERKNQQREAP